MKQKKSLYDIISDERFRERAYSSFGDEFGFWVYEDGTHSEIADYRVIEPQLRKAQRGGMRRAHRFASGDTEEQFAIAYEIVQRMQPYARSKLELLTHRLKKQPRLLVSVEYDPFDASTIKHFMSIGAKNCVRALMGIPALDLTDALLLNAIMKTTPLFAKITHHDEQPSSSYIGLFRQLRHCPQNIDVFYASNNYTIATLFGAGKRDPADPVFSFYRSARILLSPEQGIMEPEEAKREVASFES